MKLPKIEYEIIAMNDTKQFLIGIFERLLNFGNSFFFLEYKNADNANMTSPITGKIKKVEDISAPWSINPIEEKIICVAMKNKKVKKTDKSVRFFIISYPVTRQWRWLNKRRILLSNPVENLFICSWL